ncbi:ABC transporter permease [Anaerocolumna sp. AGMB13025]|uniref:ABC transporter permease n=1 Tax=Anaerocolumna sp. AGMB13025 TaxID=3039116 RepID=UPI00241F67F4|nr:ABC transporter permease [Anaerocolumna sp. AGMB13025]WFR59842.1 ABC transporter permease [Anaerocolumna sp. AGMB13025]
MKNNLFLIRLKTIFDHKLTSILMVVSVISFLFVINTLSFHAKERSSVPVGIVNLDTSQSADDVVEAIKKVPAFYVYEGKEKELKDLLYKEEIRAYFIIREGYEKSIRNGKTDELITMYYLEGDESAKILSDLIAGEMLYKICLYKGYNLYKALPFGSKSLGASGSLNRKEELSEQEYMEYANSLLTSPDFDFAFDIRMVDSSNQDSAGSIGNSILYLQAVWGITAMLLSFMAMLLTAVTVYEKEQGIRQRVKITLNKHYYMDVNHFTVTFCLLSIITLLLSLGLFFQVPGLGLAGACKIFFLSELFLAVMILWFLLLGNLTVRTVRYQLLGVFSVLIFGFLGFFSLAAGFFDNKLLNISKIIPNCWFIKEFTVIILNTNLENIPYISYIKFIITACGLLVVNGFISKRQYR